MIQGPNTKNDLAGINKICSADLDSWNWKRARNVEQMLNYLNAQRFDPSKLISAKLAENEFICKSPERSSAVSAAWILY